MRLVAALLAAIAPLALGAQTLPPPAAPAAVPAAAESPFTFEEVMIPMRDGVRLQTVIFRPRNTTAPLPILFQRTPYGVPAAAPTPAQAARYGSLMTDGYILVFQSMRGRFRSEGVFTLSTAIHVDSTGRGDRHATDESTDAYDSIDWLVKNVRPNNGRVGMWGVSYPGFAAAIALVHPHPALKAVSPQAAWIDYWQSDDLHRNGALRLTYATDWVSSLQMAKDNWTFTYPTTDTYDFFLQQGNAEAIDRNYLHGGSAMFTALLDHPNHDAFYSGQRWSDALGRTTVPTLNVAGFWDQEDPWGSWRIYERQAQNDPDHLAQMVAGPWNHGGWQGRGDTVGGGRVPIGAASGEEFKEQIQAPFFRYWLHGTARDRGPTGGSRCSSQGRTSGGPMPPGRPQALQRRRCTCAPTARYPSPRLRRGRRAAAMSATPSIPCRSACGRCRAPICPPTGGPGSRTTSALSIIGRTC